MLVKLLILIIKKNSKFKFENQRFIHTKDQIPKSFEHIVTAKMKPKIVKNSSKYQIGAMPNHRASEHLFTLKSIIALYIKLDISIILQLFDLKL